MSDDLSELSVEELRDLAKESDIKGRSTMSKEELVEALEGEARAGVQPRRQSGDPLQGVRAK